MRKTSRAVGRYPHVLPILAAFRQRYVASPSFRAELTFGPRLPGLWFALVVRKKLNEAMCGIRILDVDV